MRPQICVLNVSGSNKIEGLKKFEKTLGSKNVGSETMLGPKDFLRCWVETKFGSQIFLDLKIILAPKNLGPKKLGPKKLDPKKWVKKDWVKKDFGSDKFWVGKNVGSEQNLSPKNVWEKLFGQ